MSFRLFIVLLVAGIFVSAARAQTATKVYRVGLLTMSREGTCSLAPGLVQALAKRGYVEGKTIEFERRAANNDSASLPGMAADLAARHVDLIITCSYPAAVAVLDKAPDVPIVAIHAGDPVETGMVRSLSHPGGRLTGVSQISTDLSAKRLQLLKEAVPSVHKVAMLRNEGDLAKIIAEFGATLTCYMGSCSCSMRLSPVAIPRRSQRAWRSTCRAPFKT